MDLHDIWQEHKRWILGVVAGVVVFFVGSGIVETAYGGDVAERRALSLARSVRGLEQYGMRERKTIEDEAKKLAGEEARLRKAQEFVPDDLFVLAGKGDPDTHYNTTSRGVRERVLRLAQEAGIELADRDLRWSAPVGREEIRATMLGLCVLEHAISRLIDAGIQVRDLDPESAGLQSVDSFVVESKGGGRTPRARRGRWRRSRTPQSDVVQERIEEHVVSFQFRCDPATLVLFFEKCHSMRPPLTLLPDLKVQRGAQLGDPLIVKGRLSGLLVEGS